jgi:hypothetical protein
MLIPLNKEEVPRPFGEGSFVSYTVPEASLALLKKHFAEQIGTKTLRVILPGQIYTMEYNSGRYNIQLHLVKNEDPELPGTWARVGEMYVG